MYSAIHEFLPLQKNNNLCIMQMVIVNAWFETLQKNDLFIEATLYFFVKKTYHRYSHYTWLYTEIENKNAANFPRDHKQIAWKETPIAKTVSPLSLLHLQIFSMLFTSRSKASTHTSTDEPRPSLTSVIVREAFTFVSLWLYQCVYICALR